VHLFPDVDVHHIMITWLRFPIQSEPDDIISCTEERVPYNLSSNSSRPTSNFPDEWQQRRSIRPKTAAGQYHEATKSSPPARHLKTLMLLFLDVSFRPVTALLLPLPLHVRAT
jgi:hypothetical protein